MPDVGAAHPENHVLGDVGGMIGHALKIARHQQGIQRLPGRFRPLIHGLHQHDEGFIAHAVDDVIHFKHRLRQFGLGLDE